jgi:hypothetical protein
MWYFFLIKINLNKKCVISFNVLTCMPYIMGSNPWHINIFSINFVRWPMFSFSLVGNRVISTVYIFFQKQKSSLIIYMYARRLKIWRKKTRKKNENGWPGIRTLVLRYTRQRNLPLQQYITNSLQDISLFTKYICADAMPRRSSPATPAQYQRQSCWRWQEQPQR